MFLVVHVPPSDLAALVRSSGLPGRCNTAGARPEAVVADAARSDRGPCRVTSSISGGFTVCLEGNLFFGEFGIRILGHVLS
jgi:hypothetical protein